MTNPSSSRASQRGSAPDGEAVLSQLRVHGSCSPELVARLQGLSLRVERVEKGAVLQTAGGAIGRPRYVLQGWACRLRDLSDGRRLIFDFILPGEGIGTSRRPYAHASTTVALTPVVLTDATRLLDGDAPAVSQEITALMELTADADERRLMDGMVRIGRMSAEEGLAHLLLQLRARLAAIGLVSSESFQLPISQPHLADALGLSPVHLNRTIKLLHQRGLVSITRSRVKITDVKGLMDLAVMPVI